MKTRTQKATLNILTSAVLEVAALLYSFLIPRLVLRYYGSAYNGITTSAVQFLSLISVLTMGVTASTRVALYKTLSANDIKQTSAIVRATDKYMRKVGLILLGYLTVLACVYPLVVQTGFSFWEVASLILIVGMRAFAEYYFGITYKTLLLADQSLYVSNEFAIISTLLNVGISVLLIKLGFSIQIVKLGSAVVFFLRPLLQNIYVKRKYKLDRHCEPDMSALKKRGDAMWHALANIVHDNTDMVVLTLFAGVKTVSVYTVYNLVMNALKKIQSIFTTGTEPIFGSMWAKGELDGIRKNLGVYEYFVSAYSAVTYSVAMVMILPFVRLYTSHVTDVEYVRPWYALAIVAAFVVLSFRTPYLALVQGIGHYKETRNAAVTEAVMNIVISVVLVLVIRSELYKMLGVAIGTLAANLYRTFQYAFYIDDHVVPRGKHVVFLRMLWTFVNMAIVCLPGYFIVNGMEIHNWWTWILVAVAVSLISAAVVLVSSLIFYRRDFKRALKVGRRMAKKWVPFL